MSTRVSASPSRMGRAYERGLRDLGWWPTRVVEARGFVERLRGMGAYEPPSGGGAAHGAHGLHGSAEDMEVALAFPRCSSVHTCGMRVPLDIAFIACDGTVLAHHAAVRPWRMLACPGAAAVLERFSKVDLRADRERVRIGLIACRP